MAVFIKRLFYIINILSVISMVFIVLFSAESIIRNYNNLNKITYAIEKEYSEITDKYKKVISFILKNKLPQNIDYFNSVGRVIYNLPQIKKFISNELKDVIARENFSKAINNSNITTTVGCHSGKCIQVFIDRKEILDQISRSNLWGYGEITTIPIKRTTLLKISTNSFLETHKNFTIVILSYFFILCLFQSIFLFIKNLKLIKTNTALLNTSDKNKVELTKQISSHDKSCDSMLFIQDLAGEYFTHYIHQLITREVCITEVQLIDILHRIEKFFDCQISKRNLKIILDCEDKAKIINSDDEIIFILLLNLIYKAIYRSKISSEIFIKIFQMQEAINIEISDIGYEHRPKLSNKIKIFELPNPVLEKLFQKVKMEIKDAKKEEINIIFAKIIQGLKIKRKNEINNNVIKLDLYAKKN